MANGDSDGTFWTGASARARFRAWRVDVVSLDRTAEDTAASCTIRFRNPDGTVLEEMTLGSGVINAGDGYYYATSVPTEEGLHTAECEIGGANPGREKIQFTVAQF